MDIHKECFWVILRVPTGCPQGYPQKIRLFAGLFRKNRAEILPELTRRIAALEALCADLQEQLLAERTKAFAFRGRVYAFLGRKGVKLSEEAEAAPAPAAFDWTTCPLDDPRLTKAQVKRRLSLLTAAQQAARLKQTN